MENVKFSSFLFSIIFILTFKYGVGENLYKTKYFDVPLDHFSYARNNTFKIRYLVNDSYVRSDTDPILFYTGNEGDITLFAQNTGFMWEAAQQLNALLLFAEHRYYGASLPFGEKSYTGVENLGYLSSQQALADYADLLRSVNPGNKRAVIAIGGSYGGMLAAWFRMKYPHLVRGAIAASAPIFQFENLVPCDAFNRILTSVFTTEYKPECSENIKKSWSLIKSAASTPEGRTTLNSHFKFCKNFTEPSDVDTFTDYLTDVYANLAMANYPYGTMFLAHLPAYPVRQFCGQFSSKMNESEILPQLAIALQVYSNYTGNVKCLNISSAFDSNLGGSGWDFQSCTEMVMPSCATGDTDMFPPQLWNLNDYSDKCFKKFGVRPRDKAAITYYGDRSLNGASNIVFSNGLLDPWSGGGVLKSDNNRVHIMIIPNAAHHLDLRAATPEDPESVTIARKYHIKYIKQWLREY